MGEVTTSEKTLLDIVLEADPEHYDPEYVYEFNGGERKFYSTDRTSSGIYDGT